MPCDVSIESDVEKAIQAAVTRFGTIHVAFACAGVTAWTPTLTSRGPMDMKVFERVFSINVMGSLHVVKHAAVQLAKNDSSAFSPPERGVIILVSSIQAKEGQRAQTAYSASKGAINGMVLPMARDLGKYGIRAVAVAPNLIQTPMTGSSFSPKVMKGIVS